MSAAPIDLEALKAAAHIARCGGLNDPVPIEGEHIARQLGMTPDAVAERPRLLVFLSLASVTAYDHRTDYRITPHGALMPLPPLPRGGREVAA